MVRAKCEAEVIIPAQAERDKAIEAAKAETVNIRGQAQAELTQLKRTIEILESAGDQGLNAYIIEKFDELVQPFAQTLDLFPVQDISVIAGNTPSNGPISSIHPNAVDLELNRRIGGVMASGGAVLSEVMTTEDIAVEEVSPAAKIRLKSPTNRAEREEV